MKILADMQVHDVDKYFAQHGEVIKKSGRDICREDVLDADILLTRSITCVNQGLLKSTAVKFVGSATGGADHIDAPYLKSQNIAWSVAPGCNALSVADYVVSCIARLQLDGKLKQHPKVGVVGVGHIGKQVVDRLQRLRFTIFQNDPLRAKVESNFPHVDLQAISQCDLVCVHVPLTASGAYCTHHLVDAQFLKRLKPGCVLLNAARGAVIDFSALANLSDHLTLCLDVWEGEPLINVDILKRATIATPHVAGYAVESKARGTYMIYQAACEIFSWPLPAPFLTNTESLDLSQDDWRQAVLKVYDPIEDTIRMKETLLADNVNIKHAFDRLRMEYPERHELMV